ncbi:hypothetical protein LTR62_007010 [Meristemomyces frigidus]|uniref:Xylanolytic transcriptional activator regulatory domain-containing protein n=1 Tax=Meristemomyces frigidus TaxID=1508187 RepID=A0AAN7YE31_9PEZI|nr:hypothetical protein LTR62_007010 [Meristemomyces frigidus]
MPACGRCNKAGQASGCLYVDEATISTCAGVESRPPNAPISRPVHVTPAATTDDALARLQFRDGQSKHLEPQPSLVQAGTTHSLDAVRPSKPPLTPESAFGAGEHDAAPVVDRETMMLRGKSFKTQFHGTTHASSLIALIPELNLFTREAFGSFPALARIRQDMAALEKRTEYAGSRPRDTTGDELKAFLPPKAKTDQLLLLYLDHYGLVYHILHMPSFWKSYSEMWSDLTSASAHFVAIVLLITAAARCLADKQPWLYTANSSTHREKAIGCIQACDDWLQAQSQKKVTAADFQIRFLLLFAKYVCARKIKRTWTEAGNLLRFCMAAGLHRDPDHIRKPTSVLDRELRRRLWSAVVEFELQAAFDRGMLAAPWPLQADTPPPSNVLDEDISSEAKQLPRAEPASAFTSASYLVVASESLLLRHRLNTILNSIRQGPTFNEAKHFTEEIEAHLANIPKWIGNSAETPKALLALNLRQYLLELHIRQLRQGGTTTERSFSNMILIDNATLIIDTLGANTDGGSTALQLLCNHHLRAALAICHVATSPDIRAGSVLGQLIEQHTDRILQATINLLTAKLVSLGREQRQLWIALAAHGHWKAKRHPEQRATLMQEAVDRITRPYYRIMAMQEDASSSIGAPDTDKTKDATKRVIEYLPSFGGSGDGSGLMPVGADDVANNICIEDGLPVFDLEDVEAWTFDDFFGVDELQQDFGADYDSAVP